MKKNKFIWIFIFSTLPYQTSSDLLFNFVIWNVGQGSWSTYIRNKDCFHFDMGGDKFNLTKVIQLCQKKKNWLLVSHDDWDHIGHVNKFRKNLFSLCIHYPKKTKYRFLKSIKPCPKLPLGISTISLGNDDSNRNASSIVYLLEKKVLISGDAPISEEKKWLHFLPKKLFLLILGHHGSNTSTSVNLLKQTRPSMAIASARKKKYGHPHPSVIKKLKRFHIPLLKTESLGDIYIQL